MVSGWMPWQVASSSVPPRAIPAHLGCERSGEELPSAAVGARARIWPDSTRIIRTGAPFTSTSLAAIFLAAARWQSQLAVSSRSLLCAQLGACTGSLPVCESTKEQSVHVTPHWALVAFLPSIRAVARQLAARKPSGWCLAARAPSCRSRRHDRTRRAPSLPQDIICSSCALLSPGSHLGFVVAAAVTRVATELHSLASTRGSLLSLARRMTPRARARLTARRDRIFVRSGHC